MNDKLLDTIYDIVTYTTAGICFIGAMVFIIISITDTLGGWKEVTTHLYNAGLLLIMGIGVSLFIFYMRSWSKRR